MYIHGDDDVCMYIHELLYSVMASQRMDGGQSNNMLVHRTKVDWSLPFAVPGLMEHTAERHLQTTRAPIMAYSDRRNQ